MRNDEIKAVFDQQASSCDERWAKTAPIRDALYFLLEAVFAELPANARILSVGVGTGEEMSYLAKRFPQWTFVAVEFSGAMLDVCRNKAEKEGFISQCSFHEGYTPRPSAISTCIALQRPLPHAGLQGWRI